jgi:hypothetical protein
MSPPPRPSGPHRTHRTSRRSPVAIGIAAILLVVAVVASFWVPLYARSTPKLGAFPFFYWYQLILVPAVAIVSWIAYLLVRADSGGGPASPADPNPDPNLGLDPGGGDGREAAL